MTEREEVGRTLVSQADTLLAKKAGLFSSLLGSSSDKYDDAADLYVRAANEFKLARSFRPAAAALVKAAQAKEAAGGGSGFEAATKYSDAAKCLKNIDKKEAVGPYQEAIRIHTQAGRLQQAAKLMKEVAELCEGEQDVAAAIGHYKQAADIYDAEDARSHASACRVKVAELSALEGDYVVAIEMYEGSARVCLDNNLLKFGAKEHLLRAGMCWMCRGDEVGASRAIEKYTQMDSSFGSSREGTFLEKIVKAAENGDPEEFTTAVYDFDRVLKLDPWKTSILLRIKNTIKEAEDDLT